mmetsp:Transcript_15357/g.19195  ORF Transcript_15357/g.19195 Transcript_15357/m.19195 type:complete len:406 (+) Transcript_15357:110-1327(+)|eukprot:CAMPEP_0172480170 /NCGR_PEP_ID=MMETSP1066-20121228/5167_1 /TAXON_ID=671091 /ORGANISM="Coscinodiscus wailesii, Strain CCMP2513" /LENGTH=405 /DNA_ID=CAMNT_0013241259 /DNA_START=86 /DNA_END=1303 /DNA_ORIENTATION=+
MNNLFGSKLTNKNGDSLQTNEALSGKIVGIYFSAHWCPPCRGFTPALAKTYDSIKNKSGKPFEIVFVSSDRDEDSFKEYLSEMPWLALPFSERDRKNKLSKKYKIKGIPALVIIDSSNGETITSKGREVVTSNPEGFPWKPRPVSAVLGDTLRKPDGSTIDAGSALEGKVLGLYFSAHWCPPCRQFTPEFAGIYKKLKNQGKEFEVVFVSSDRSEADFNKYHSSQPWLALPFSERDAKEELSSMFDVDGIPSLIILDEKRSIINANARSAVSNVDDFPWYPKPVKDLNVDPGDINDGASLVVLIEGGDDDEQEDIVKMLEQVEKEHRAAGGDVQFYYVTNESEMSRRLRAMTKLGNPMPHAQMLMVDIPDRGAYYVSEAQEVDEKCVFEFINRFKSGSLERKQLS